jgi:hypothetical protein
MNRDSRLAWAIVIAIVARLAVLFALDAISDLSTQRNIL